MSAELIDELDAAVPGLTPVAVAAAARPVRTITLAGNQPQQEAFLKDWMPGVTLASGGWGSGKTYAGARKFMAIHRYNQCPGIMVGPTWGDLARLMVPEVLNACREWGTSAQYWPHGHGNDQFPHMVLFGQVVYLFSGDSPERITGVQAGHGWGDEAARFLVAVDNPVRNAPVQIRGRLRHPDAKVLHLIYTTTPEGMDTFIQRDFFDKPLPEHRAYFIPTKGNLALRPEFLENIRATIPEGLQAQYLEGHAVSYAANRAHPNFDTARHHLAAPWIPSAPVHIGCDFNVSPMCWVAAQVQPDGTVLVIDELVIDNHAQVDQAVVQCDAKGWGTYAIGTAKAAREVVIHPDKASKNRSTTGDPEVTTLLATARRLRWNASGNANGANPPINGRINNVERAFLDAAGRVRLKVHPRCERLTQELQRVPRLANGYDPGKAGLNGHILDALGYLIWDLLPIAPAVESARNLWSR